MKYENPKNHRAYRAIALEIGGRIAEQAYKKRKTLTAQAEQAKVSQGNLSRMGSDGTCCIQLMGLYKIASALEVPISKILPPGGWA